MSGKQGDPHLGEGLPVYRTICLFESESLLSLDNYTIRADSRFNGFFGDVPLTSCEQRPYGGWNQAHLIDNDHLELVVVTEIGPRVMHLGLKGSHNLFRNLEHELGQTGGEEFRLYGGQRLWALPESAQETYCPDNVPVDFRQLSEHVFQTVAPVEETTGLQKELRIELASNRPEAKVVHTITNRGSASRKISPWALP